MIDRLEAERLANAIHSLRPDWPVRSLLGFLKQREARPLLELTIELAWVAQLPDTQTPARIDAPGPWKGAVTGGRVAPPIQYPKADDCRVCGRHPALIHVDHDYEARLPPSEWAKPTPEQKAAIEKARVEALAARPEPEPKREPRPVAEVLAAHTSTTNTTEDVA